VSKLTELERQILVDWTITGLPKLIAVTEAALRRPSQTWKDGNEARLVAVAEAAKRLLVELENALLNLES
jgi:hypothetical protein